MGRIFVAFQCQHHTSTAFARHLLTFTKAYWFYRTVLGNWKKALGALGHKDCYQKLAKMAGNVDKQYLPTPTPRDGTFRAKRMEAMCEGLITGWQVSFDIRGTAKKRQNLAFLACLESAKSFAKSFAKLKFARFNCYLFTLSRITKAKRCRPTTAVAKETTSPPASPSLPFIISFVFFIFYFYFYFFFFKPKGQNLKKSAWRFEVQTLSSWCY